MQVLSIVLLSSHAHHKKWPAYPWWKINKARWRFGSKLATKWPLKLELSDPFRHITCMRHESHSCVGMNIFWNCVPHIPHTCGQAAGFTGGIWLFGLWQSEESVEDTREKLGLHHDLKRRVATSDPQTEPTQALDSLNCWNIIRSSWQSCWCFVFHATISICFFWNSFAAQETKGPTVLGNSKFSISASKPEVRIG